MTTLSAEERTPDSLEALLLAFWNDMQRFSIGAVFDHRGTYGERRRDCTAHRRERALLIEKSAELAEANQDLHESALRLGHALQEAQIEANAYHEIMGALRCTKMEHGLCEPVERHACTRCEAERRIERMLSEYKGRRVRLA